MQDIIGIDISKDRLDAFRLSDRQHNAFGNDKAGFKALLKWIGSAEGLRIVYEPTGPYHRGMEAALADVGHALVKVNPRQARRFAEATGTPGQDGPGGCDAAGADGSGARPAAAPSSWRTHE